MQYGSFMSPFFFFILLIVVCDVLGSFRLVQVKNVYRQGTGFCPRIQKVDPTEMFSCASRAIRGLKSYYAPSLSRILASGYKSDLSLDKLYPSSNQDFLRQVPICWRHGIEQDPYSCCPLIGLNLNQNCLLLICPKTVLHQSSSDGFLRIFRLQRAKPIWKVGSV